MSLAIPIYSKHYLQSMHLRDCNGTRTKWLWVRVPLQSLNVISNLEKSENSLLNWFKEKHMRTNADKCHLLVSSDESCKAKIEDFSIKNSAEEKLLAVIFDSNLSFENHVISFCKKASEKSHALVRISHYMDLNKRRNVMKAFISSQFSYCPLIWMFHSRN